MNGNLPIVSLKKIYNPVKDFRNKAAKNQWDLAASRGLGQHKGIAALLYMYYSMLQFFIQNYIF